VVTPIIAKDLIEVASHCFANRIIPKSFKEFIIVVLYKKEKKNYSLRQL